MTQAAVSSIETVIRNLEGRRIQAMVEKDLGALEPLLADELSYVHSGGRIDDKPAFLELIANPDLLYKDIAYTESKFVPCGPEAAVLRGIARLRLQRLSQDKEDRVYSVVFSVVYRKRDDGWRLVVWHATRAQEYQQIRKDNDDAEPGR